MPQRHGARGRFVGGGGSGGGKGGGTSLKAQQKAQNKALGDARKAQAKATKQIGKRSGAPKQSAPTRPQPVKGRKTSSKVRLNPKTLGVKGSVRVNSRRGHSSAGIIKGAIRVARKVG